MAFSKTLVVDDQDVYTFQFKATKNGKIYKFWRQIIERMSKSLKTEVRSKSTNLIKKEETSDYYFETKFASKELKEYLSNFVVKSIEDPINNSNEVNS